NLGPLCFIRGQRRIRHLCDQPAGARRVNARLSAPEKNKIGRRERKTVQLEGRSKHLEGAAPGAVPLSPSHFPVFSVCLFRGRWGIRLPSGLNGPLPRSVTESSLAAK